MQPNVDIAEALRQGFNLYKENITTLLLVTLLATVISACTVGILAGPMMAGLALVVLRLIDKTEPKPEVGDLFKGFDFFIPSLVFAILVIVAQLAGRFILFWIPILGYFLGILYSVALSTFLMFTIYLLVDRKLDVVAAIQQSIDLVKKNFWIFLGLNIIVGLVSAIGIFACGIGILVTMPIYATTIGLVYRNLHPAGQPSA
ncbi:MAG: hypothetical protein H3C50_08050 [Kiritimatiellae bacterium]|nr:hypothetical protein [Kiritimatiellia bacterium]MCO5068480.1 hypothetical protein [Kiritimatiellia bacterium]